MRRAEPGAVHLVGGGRSESALVSLFSRFVADAAAHTSARKRSPRIHALLVLERGIEQDVDESIARVSHQLDLAGADVVVHSVLEGEVFTAAAIEDAEGIFVGGGLTPAYRGAFAGVAAQVREQVFAGVPYLGFSAGAAIASERALIGGYLLAGAAVCDEHAGEELDEVMVVDGLGLVPFCVDVHAAQWGTVSRLIAAADAGLIESGFAIDEHTAVSCWAGDHAIAASVAGEGAAWHVSRGGGDTRPSVCVTRRVAAPARI